MPTLRRSLVVVALVLASCRRSGRTHLEQSDCAGVERYAREQVDAIVAQYRQSDLNRNADLAALRALIDRDMADARTDWVHETDRVPFDCHVAAIGTLWLALDSLGIAVDVAGPTSSDRVGGRQAVAAGIARLQSEPIAAFQACRTPLGRLCR